MIVLYFADHFFLLAEIGPSYNFYDFLFSSTIWFKVRKCTSYFTLFNIGLYALYLKHFLSKPEEKISLQNFFRFIQPEHWKKYFVILFLLILYYSFTFVDVIDTDSGIAGVIEEYTQPGWYEFYNWVNRLFRLLGMWLPFIAASFLVFWDEHSAMNKGDRKIFFQYLWSTIVLTYFLYIISDNLSYLVDDFVINVAIIPFQLNGAKTIVSWLIASLTLSYFYIGFAAAILFSVLQMKNDTLVNEEE
jgi:hypothetical protein